jgi:hypothetical protein
MRKVSVFYASLAFCGFAAIWVALHHKTQMAARSAPPNPTAKISTSSAPGPAGFRVYLDPVTGKPGQPPKQALPEPAAAAIFNSSHEGLVEVPGTSRAGGFKVEARGHFQSATVVQLGPDGKPTTRCVAGDAEASSRQVAESAVTP